MHLSSLSKMGPSISLVGPGVFTTFITQVHHPALIKTISKLSCSNIIINTKLTNFLIDLQDFIEVTTNEPFYVVVLGNLAQLILEVNSSIQVRASINSREKPRFRGVGDYVHHNVDSLRSD